MTPERKSAFRAVVQKMIDQYPGVRCSVYHLQSKLVYDVLDDNRLYSQISDEAMEYILELRDSGELSVTKGRNGGVLLQWQTPDPIMRPGRATEVIELPKPTDNYTCTRCGNKKLCTHTDKSCWSCGEPVQR